MEPRTKKGTEVFSFKFEKQTGRDLRRDIISHSRSKGTDETGFTHLYAFPVRVILSVQVRLTLRFVFSNVPGAFFFFF